MDTDTHPNPQPNPHHRKIDLQSPADLLYLQRNLSAAATEKLNLHFPPKHAYATHIPLDGTSQTNDPPEAPADPMRLRVEELVTAFLRETWSNAKASISVNGLDAHSIPDHFSPPATTPQDPAAGDDTEIEGIHFQYAPYDPRLSTKLATLYAEVESLTSTVSNLRRTNPRSGAEAYVSGLESAIEEDERVYNSQREHAQRVPPEVLTLQPVPADAPELYERGLSGLAGLSGLNASSHLRAEGGKKQASLTETVGKVQRARRVVGELE